MTGIVVSHTHWDRAWYLPFERFRVRLVRMVDRLLDLLEGDPAFRAFTHAAPPGAYLYRLTAGSTTRAGTLTVAR